MSTVMIDPLDYKLTLTSGPQPHICIALNLALPSWEAVFLKLPLESPAVEISITKDQLPQDPMYTRSVRITITATKLPTALAEIHINDHDAADACMLQGVPSCPARIAIPFAHGCEQIIRAGRSIPVKILTAAGEPLCTLGAQKITRPSWKELQTHAAQ